MLRKRATVGGKVPETRSVFVYVDDHPLMT